MNPLPLTANAKEIHGIIKCNPNLFSNIKFPKGGLRKKADKKRIINQINAAIIVWKKSKHLIFDLDQKYQENCKETYLKLATLPGIFEVNLIAKCISEYAASEYINCASCSTKRLFQMTCDRCSKRYCKLCHSMWKGNLCRDCMDKCEYCNKLVLNSEMMHCEDCCYDSEACRECAHEHWYFNEDQPGGCLFWCPHCLRDQMSSEEFENYFGYKK